METADINKPEYTKRFTAITLGVLAVASPLFVDKFRYNVTPDDEDDEDEGVILASWLILPMILVSLIIAINFANLFHRSYFRFDPYWIHRVGGSSFGIGLFLFLLAIILNFKSSF